MPQALYLPADLANYLRGRPAGAPAGHRPALEAGKLASIDQWTQLVRSFSCDLSGSRDLGWHRVPLRTYESAIHYPLQWATWGRAQRPLAPHTASATIIQRRSCRRKIDFWVGGRIDEIRYDRRQQRIDARFPAAGARSASGVVAQCAYTTLQFRQQNGLWLLSGVEPNLAPRC